MRNEENIFHSHNFMTIESNPAKQGYNRCKKFRTWVNLFEDHSTHWETFEHTCHHLALEFQMLEGIQSSLL